MLETELVKSLLQQLGFKCEERSSGVWWTYSNNDHENSRSQSSVLSTSSLWTPSRIEFHERRKGIKLNRLEATLHQDQLVERLKKNASIYFGSRIKTEVILGRRNEFCCIFQGINKSSKQSVRKPKTGALGSGMDWFDLSSLENPQSVFGFKIQMAIYNGMVQVYLYDYFLLGSLQREFARLAVKYVARCFGLYPNSGGPEIKFLSSSDDTQSSADLVSLISLQELHFSPLSATLQELIKNTKVSDFRESFAKLPFQLRPNKAEQFNSSLVAENGKYLIEIASARDTLSRLLVPLIPLPVEILETHERLEAIQNIERAFLKGKGQHSELESAVHETRQLNPYLLNRSAALLVSGGQISERASSSIRNYESGDDILVISAAIKLLQKSRDHGAALRFLSRLGKRFETDLPNLEAVSSFDVLLPELFGDFWCDEDPKKAFVSYQRALQKRGLQPRILRKMLLAARQIPDVSLELDSLSKLMSIEKNHDALAAGYLRMAKILATPAFSVTGAAEYKDPIFYALKSLQLQRNNMEVITFVAELYSSKGMFELAIQTIDQITKDPQVELDPVNRAKLEQLIGDIWQNGLGRPDLAQTRYEQSLQRIGESSEVLDSLAHIYRSQGQTEKLASILEVILDQTEKKGAFAEFSQVYFELANLYNHQIGNFHAAYGVFRRLIRYPDLLLAEYPKIKDLLFNLPDQSAVDFLELYEDMNAVVPQLRRPEARVKMRGFLAEMSEICLKDEGRKIFQLTQSLKDGMGDFGRISSLITALEGIKDYAALEEVFARCLTSVSDVDEKAKIIRRILGIPEILTSEIKDDLSVKLVQQDERHCDLLTARFEYYVRSNEPSGMTRLVDLLSKSAVLSKEFKEQWLMKAWPYVEAINHEDSALALERLTEHLVAIVDDKPRLFEMACRSMLAKKNLSKVAGYLGAIVKLGVLPSFAEADVIKALQSEEKILAQYYYLLAEQSADANASLRYADVAWTLLKRTQDTDQNRISGVLGKLGSLTKLADSDLRLFEKQANEAQTWAPLAKVLSTQIELETDPSIRFALLIRLADLYQERLNDFSAARTFLLAALKLDITPSRTLIKLAQLARRQGDLKGECDYKLELLRDAAILSQPAELKGLLEWMIDKSDVKEQVIDIMVSYIGILSKKGQHADALLLCQQMEKLGYRDEEILRAKFEVALLTKSNQAVAEAWVDLLEKYGMTPKSEAFRKQSLAQLQALKVKNLLPDCYQHFMAKDRQGVCGEEIYLEIVIDYATLLFHDNIHREHALVLFEKAARIRPLDPRIWIPHYMLLNEFGDDESRINQLKWIIPLIEEKRHAIAKFPVTIESLKLQLRRLEKLPDERPIDVAIKPAADQNFFLAVSEGSFSSGSNVHSKINTGMFSLNDSPHSRANGQAHISATRNTEKRHLALVKSQEPGVHLSKPPKDPEFAVKFALDEEVVQNSDLLSDGSREDVPDSLPVATLDLGMSRLGQDPAEPLAPMDSANIEPVIVFDLEQQKSAGVGEERAGAGDGGTKGEREGEMQVSEDLKPQDLPVPPLPATLLPPPPLVLPRVEAQEPLDWRQLVSAGRVSDSDLELALNTKFASEVEKHLALQAMGLINGNLETVTRNWESHVWRDASKFFYPLSSRGRIPDSFSGYKSEDLAPLQTLLFRLIQMLAPVFIKIYRVRFSGEYMGRIAKIKADRLPKAALPLDWKGGLLKRAGLDHYAERFKQRQITPLDLKGLNQVIFYDGREKKIYLDTAFYRELPPTNLFHRVVNMLWEIRLNYYVPLALEPKTFVLPVLNYIVQRPKEISVPKKARLIKNEKTMLADAVARLDQRVLWDLVEKVGKVQDAQLYGLWKAMRLYSRCLAVAETLDVVGSFEAISGRDLLQKRLQPDEANRLFSDADFLLNLVTQISI